MLLYYLENVLTIISNKFSSYSILYWHITLKHPLYTHSMCLPFLVHSRLGFEHSTLTLSRIPIFLFVSFFAWALTIALNVPTLRLYLSLSLYVVSHGYTTRVHPLQSSERKVVARQPPRFTLRYRLWFPLVDVPHSPSPTPSTLTFAFKLD